MFVEKTIAEGKEENKDSENQKIPEWKRKLMEGKSLKKK